MQNVAASKKLSNESRVVTLRRRNLGSFAHTIYQSDLEEVLIARTEMKNAEKKLGEKEQYIAAALRGGATIEAGLHTAELKRIDRKGFRVKAGMFFRLAVRVFLLALLPMVSSGQTPTKPRQVEPLNRAGSNSSEGSLHLEQLDGGSVVTELGHLKVNEGSSLRRKWIVLNCSDCAVRITGAGIKSSYKSGGIYRGEYLLEPYGTMTSEKALAAFEIRFVLLDVWGHSMKTLSLLELRDVPATTMFDFRSPRNPQLPVPAWRSSENETERLLTIVSYVSRVRFTDGTSWTLDPRKVVDAVSKIQLQITEEALIPETTKN